MTFNERVATFRREVWSYYKKHGRDNLPWRKTHDPYKTLVSEMMLQQTQVHRVMPKYRSFIKKFPSARALAQALLRDVLKEWSGLGYNRRGKFLWEAAKKIEDEFGGDFKAALGQRLLGVGPYTVAAVRVFAFNEPEVLLETNVRTVFIHAFYRGRSSVQDSDMLIIARKAAAKQDPRTWHWALMDYGAHLKKSGVRNNSRSAHYAKQSKFEGSPRQVRGAILRELHRGPSSVKSGTFPFARSKVEAALASLSRDGLVKKERGRWRIA